MKGTKDMGLLSTEVEVRLDGVNIKHFEKLGYDIPKYCDKEHKKYRVKKGTTIMVKVEDLLPRSRVKIDVECDACHNKKDILYCAYHSRKNSESDKYYCEHCAAKIYISGESNHFWNPNLTDEDRINNRKATTEYNNFLRKVLARDKYICQCCGNTNKEMGLEVHHLDGFDWCKEKRTDTTNGITLCRNCHSNFHITYGKGGNTKEQFEEWIGRVVDVLKFEKELSPARKIYCIEEDKVYNSANEIKQKYKLSSATQIYDACNRNNTKIRTIKSKHFLYYDEYLTMSEEEVNYFVNVLKVGHFKAVACITTGEIFDRIVDAEKKYPQSKKIWDCCQGRQSYSGKLPDGTKLQWAYYKSTEELVKL